MVEFWYQFSMLKICIITAKLSLSPTIVGERVGVRMNNVGNPHPALSPRGRGQGE
jgi:hypothetical protein